MNVERLLGRDPYSATGVPELGLRNYWYPVLAGWRLRRRPKAVTVLGENIVLFRDGGRVYALSGRCPHRGARLSQGNVSTPAAGRQAADIMDGPSPGKPDAASQS
jgi:hypothetical protein